MLSDGDTQLPSYDILRDKMIAGEPIDVSYGIREDQSREGKTSGCYSGTYIITSLELDGQAGDDAKYSVSLENTGAVTKTGSGLTTTA